MNKKKISFTIHSLGFGGAQKSLVNLVNQIPNDVDIDIFLLHKSNNLSSSFKREVKIIQPSRRMIFIDQIRNHKEFLKNFSLVVFLRFIIAFLVIIFARIKHKNLSQYRKDQIKWRYVWKKSIRKSKDIYDLSVGFMDGISSYFAIDLVNSKKCVLWSHHDYSEYKSDVNFDFNYFKAADFIVFVSNSCKEIFLKFFPNIDKSKLKVFSNMIDYEDICTKMHEYDPKEFKNCSELKILSVGRLCKIKHFDLILSIAKFVKVKFLWIIIGDGPDGKYLVDLVNKNDMANSVKFIGAKDNPYPYFAKADVFVQTSYFEAKSIVIDEAKIFNLPILCSNYPTAYDSLSDYDNYYICKNVEEFAKFIDATNQSAGTKHLKNPKNNIDTVDFLIGIINLSC